MDHFKTCNKSAHDCYHSHAWIITIENCFSKLTFEIQLLTLSSSYTCSNNLEFMLRYIKLYYAERLLVHHVCPSSKTDSPKLSMFSYHNQRSQRLSDVLCYSIWRKPVRRWRGGEAQTNTLADALVSPPSLATKTWRAADLADHNYIWQLSALLQPCKADHHHGWGHGRGSSINKTWSKVQN